VTLRNHHEVVEELAASALQAVYMHADPVGRMEALEPVVAGAVADPYWLGAPYQRVQGAGTYYLLWTDAESGVSLVAMTLGPGDETPIHDHLTWGVVGVYQGAQHETRFVAGGSGLRQTSSRPRNPGSVTHLLPPDDDVHYVRNESHGSSAISVFFMGANLGCTTRHVYERDGRSTEVVSGYANRPCAQQTRNPYFVSQFM
jgi:predicted metal-dependent enzyme (double-stranded beta helix superfamily)